MVTGRPEWVDTVEASRLAGVSVDLVLRAIVAGELPGNKHHPARPGRWSVRTVDVQTWAQQESPASLRRLATSELP